MPCRVYAQADPNLYSALPRRGDNQNSGIQQENYIGQTVVSQSDHYRAEDPYEWVAPRKPPGSGNPRHAGRVADRLSNEIPVERHRLSNQFSPPGRSFMNQMYMDHAELQKLRQEQQRQNEGYPSDKDHGYHSSKEGYIRVQGFSSPSDRPR